MKKSKISLDVCVMYMKKAEIQKRPKNKETLVRAFFTVFPAMDWRVRMRVHAFPFTALFQYTNHTLIYAEYLLCHLLLAHFVFKCELKLWGDEKCVPACMFESMSREKV